MKTEEDIRRQNERALRAALKDMQAMGNPFPSHLYQHFEEGNGIENPGLKRYKPKFK